PAEQEDGGGNGTDARAVRHRCPSDWRVVCAGVRSPDEDWRGKVSDRRRSPARRKIDQSGGSRARRPPFSPQPRGLAWRYSGPTFTPTLRSANVRRILGG